MAGCMRPPRNEVGQTTTVASSTAVHNLHFSRLPVSGFTPSSRQERCQKTDNHLSAILSAIVALGIIIYLVRYIGKY